MPRGDGRGDVSAWADIAGTRYRYNTRVREHDGGARVTGGAACPLDRAAASVVVLRNIELTTRKTPPQSVLHINIPRLRDRPALVDFFARRFFDCAGDEAYIIYCTACDSSSLRSFSLFIRDVVMISSIAVSQWRI